MYLDEHPECWLDEDQKERLFGTVADTEGPFARIEVGPAWNTFPRHAPDGLCYIASCTSGRELAALVDYTRPARSGSIWIRVIDEDTRGWNSIDFADELFGARCDGVSYALVAGID